MLTPAPWEVIKTCINCLNSIPKEDMVCNECGHNQSIPVIKRPILIHEMAKIIGSRACFGQQDIINFIDEFTEEPIKNQNTKDKAYVEVMTAKLSIFYIIISINYNKDYNYNKILSAIESEINNQFNDIFDKDFNSEVWGFFLTRFNQYLDAFKDENYIETISTMLQFILEQTIAGNDIEALEGDYSLSIIAKELAYPLWSRNMRCAFFVGNYIEFITLWSNRWKIE